MIIINTYLLTAAIIIIACVLFNKISSKLGIPTLLAFILLGMFFGSDGIVKIHFDNYAFAEQVCSISLVFIMFYGGFGTNINEAKPVAVKAVLLSSLGTFLTAGLVGLFCWGILKFPILESFLIGAVISSTDAASVFSILRSKHLNLRYNTASLLEIESGSNDPFAYMLTIIMLSLMEGGVSGGEIAYMLFSQVIYGVVIGIILAYASLKFMKKFAFAAKGFDAIFIVAVALLSFAVPSVVGGNGYLSAYVAGIILGNHKLKNKGALVNFFDGATGLMQMLLFFLLGLLSFPSQLPSIALSALFIALFMTFIARPAAVFMILSPFKSKMRQQMLVSWTGLRGAASIVFAIMTVVSPAFMSNDIFHIVFFIVLFSILIQGSLIPFLSKKLDMTDENSDVMKTFTDYTEELPISFIQFTIREGHEWADKQVKDIVLPPESIFVLMIRNGEKIVPNGLTFLHEGDKIILSGISSEKVDGVQLFERVVVQGDKFADKKIKDISFDDGLLITICRDDKVLIPRGNTTLRANDILIINET